MMETTGWGESALAVVVISEPPEDTGADEEEHGGEVAGDKSRWSQIAIGGS